MAKVLLDGPAVEGAAANKSLITCGFLPLFLPTGKTELSKAVAAMLAVPLPGLAGSAAFAAIAPHEERHSCEPAGCMAMSTAEWVEGRQRSRRQAGTAD